MFMKKNFLIVLLFGFLKVIFFGSIFLTNKHLFLTIKYEQKVVIANKIKKIKISFSDLEALIFFIIRK